MQAHPRNPTTAPRRRRARRAAAAVGVLAVFLLPARPAGHLGDPLGEADNHLWMFWREAERLVAGRAGPYANLPDGVPIPLMDPVNLPAFLAGWLGGGPVAGWWAVAVFDVALALVGGWLLARRFAGARGAAVGAVAAATAPFLSATLDFGITEAWAGGWLALHVAFLVRHARGGRARDALAAGAFLGAAALAGWYQAFFALVVEAALVPVLLWRHRRPGTVLQGLVGLAMVLPALLRFLAVRDAWAGRWAPPSPRPPLPRPTWAELPVHGADLLTFVLPHPEPVHPAKSAYLGLVVLALCGLGLLRAPRRTLPLLALAAPFLALAAGPWPSVAGRALGVRGPAWWLATAAPALQGLTHWDRAVGAAVPFLAAAAAVGASTLPRRWALAAALAVLVDHLALAPVAWPRTTIEGGAPPVFDALPGPGGVVELPFDNGRVPFSSEPARTYQRWQVFHGRPISENYEGRDVVLVRSPLVAAVDAACGVRLRIPPEQRPFARRPGPEEAPLGAALEREVRRLRAWGYRYVVLHAGRCRHPARVTRLLDERLGVGHRLEDGDRWWPLRVTIDSE